MKKLLVLAAIIALFGCETGENCLLCDKYKRRAVSSGNPEWDYVGMGKLCDPTGSKTGGYYYTSEGKSYYRYGGCVQW